MVGHCPGGVLESMGKGEGQMGTADLVSSEGLGGMLNLSLAGVGLGGGEIDLGTGADRVEADCKGQRKLA